MLMGEACYAKSNIISLRELGIGTKVEHNLLSQANLTQNKDAYQNSYRMKMKILLIFTSDSPFQTFLTQLKK